MVNFNCIQEMYSLNLYSIVEYVFQELLYKINPDLKKFAFIDQFNHTDDKYTKKERASKQSLSEALEVSWNEIDLERFKNTLPLEDVRKFDDICEILQTKLISFSNGDTSYQSTLINGLIFAGIFTEECMKKFQGNENEIFKDVVKMMNAFFDSIEIFSDLRRLIVYKDPFEKGLFIGNNSTNLHLIVEYVFRDLLYEINPDLRKFLFIDPANHRDVTESKQKLSEALKLYLNEINLEDTCDFVDNGGFKDHCRFNDINDIRDVYDQLKDILTICVYLRPLSQKYTHQMKLLGCLAFAGLHTDDLIKKFKGAEEIIFKGVVKTINIFLKSNGIFKDPQSIITEIYSFNLQLIVEKAFRELLYQLNPHLKKFKFIDLTDHTDDKYTVKEMMSRQSLSEILKIHWERFLILRSFSSLNKICQLDDICDFLKIKLIQKILYLNGNVMSMSRQSQLISCLTDVGLFIYECMKKFNGNEEKIFKDVVKMMNDLFELYGIFSDLRTISIYKDPFENCVI